MQHFKIILRDLFPLQIVKSLDLENYHRKKKEEEEEKKRERKEKGKCKPLRPGI